MKILLLASLVAASVLAFSVHADFCFVGDAGHGPLKVIEQEDLRHFPAAYRAGEFGCSDCSTGVYIVGVRNAENGEARVAVLVDKKSRRGRRPRGLINQISQVFVDGQRIGAVEPITERGMGWERRQDFAGISRALGDDVFEVLLAGWGGIDAFSVSFAHENGYQNESEYFEGGVAAFRFNHLPQGFQVRILQDASSDNEYGGGEYGGGSGEAHFVSVSPDEFSLRPC